MALAVKLLLDCPVAVAGTIFPPEYSRQTVESVQPLPMEEQKSLFGPFRIVPRVETPLAASLLSLRSLSILLAFLVPVAAFVGCTRTKYRRAADRDSYSIVQEKAVCLSEDLPADYSIKPDSRSRFYDPSNPDCPQLPVPSAILNAYSLPALHTDSGMSAESERAISEPAEGAESDESKPMAQDGARNESSVSRVTVPTQAWEVLPRNCLERMLEFESLRQEYAQSFDGRAPNMVNATSRRLNLANLMELATINSRDYQARKEVLFRAALALTRQRYRYELNPTPFGNGASANYSHLRRNGNTTNQLAVPSGVGVQSTLASGGEFLARFANSVVLTFNGPSGFAADVGSEMIFDFQQTVFQRDVRFESLTQSERDVIYAARDYIRFRKQLFRDVSNQYYNLLLNFRGIEINAQDYFTNLRGFLQSQVEYRTAEKIPRIQVDQFEQNVLRTRSNLVNNCFTLEAALDQLKFRLGLPTEIPLYMDLSELESISLKDELSVARQMITRTRAELLNARNASSLDTTTLANVAEVLADRMSNILKIQKRLDKTDSAENPTAMQASQSDTVMPSSSVDKAFADLKQLTRLLKIFGVKMQVDMLRKELNNQVQSEPPAPPLRILVRALEFCSAQLQVVDLAMGGMPSGSAEITKTSIAKRRSDLKAKHEALVAFINEISTSLKADKELNSIEGFEIIPEKMNESLKLVERLEKLALDATQGLLPEEGDSIEDKLEATVDKTLKLSDSLLEKGPDGWEEIVLDHDEALLTGLVQRLDLMNQRGDLADAWRQIKLAGDDLKSIVDLRATQSLRTKSNANNPFDFSFDDSETRMSVALDTPLNRRLQRNNFRLALINYNVGLRNLMAAEDSIKLDVREDLRQLALDRNQYTIAVAGAALAYERVISTQLRLQFSVVNVAARDFLESQQAYTNALSAIARQHVNYITDRIELFFDLEGMDIDDNGYWQGVTQDYGPQVNVDFPSTNPRPYDSLPPRVWYSKSVRQMEQIAPGEAMVVPNR